MGEVRGLRAIRKARMAKRFGEDAVAHAIGVSKPKYRKIEEDPESMTKAQARALASYLGCSEEDLFYLPEKGN